MELRDIEYFAVIAEHAHLGRAAEALDLSTAALSKCLRRLETSLNAKLVTRTPRGVALTIEGDALLARIQRLRSSLADVAREVGDLSNGRVGHLRIGAHAGVLRDLVARACSALVNEAPKVTLDLTIGSNDDIEAGLEKGELDLIVNSIPSPLENTIQELLYQDEFVVYCSADHRLARRERVTVPDIAQEHWAMWSRSVPSWHYLSRAFADRGLPEPRIAVTTSSVPLRHAIVAHSELLGLNLRRVVQQAASDHRLAELPVEGIELPLRTGITYRKGAYLAPAARRFIAAIKETARAIRLDRVSGAAPAPERGDSRD